MAAPSLPRPLRIEEGADWSWTFQWTTVVRDSNGQIAYRDDGSPDRIPHDLTGYASVTARMQARENLDDALPIFTLTGDAFAPGGGIVIDLATARFTAAIDKDTIAGWKWTAAVFDFFVTTDGVPHKLIGVSSLIREPAVTA